MWADESVFYHIYPLGFCGAEKVNDFAAEPRPRLRKILSWIPHLCDLGINAVYLGPVFESAAHGYDTADYFWVDRRLGTNQDLKDVVSALHNQGIKVILDGVFNHVGRHFWAFEDLRRKGRASRYCSWFFLDFTKDNGYRDGFCYEGWDGCDDLVKLNLRHPEVSAHLFAAIETWIKEFDIDGLRLDVAHYLDKNFLKNLRRRCRSLKNDFWLMGEVCFGNYRRWANPEMLDSITNYECYKGLHSSCNDHNMYELAHYLQRQYGQENGVYRGLNLFSFLDNHDVSRIASVIHDARQLKAIYTLMFCMPGIPSLYYGSEWGIGGRRERSDDEVRPCLELKEDADLTLHIRYLIDKRKQTPALAYGDYQQVALNNELLAFIREYNGQKILVAANIGDQDQIFEYAKSCFRLPPFRSEIYEI